MDLIAKTSLSLACLNAVQYSIYCPHSAIRSKGTPSTHLHHRPARRSPITCAQSFTRHHLQMPIPFPAQSQPGAPLPGPSARSPSFTSSISYPSTDEDNDDASSTSSFDQDEQSALIQAEWEESMRQLEMIISIVLVPFFGKWWGRKWAFWGESKVQDGCRVSDAVCPVIGARY